MLDLFAVKNQIDEMVADECRAQEDFREKLEMAVQAYRGWQADWQTLAEKIARSRTSWLMPGIVEGLDVIPTCPQRPEKISIAATDGSQIFPIGMRFPPASSLISAISCSTTARAKSR